MPSGTMAFVAGDFIADVAGESFMRVAGSRIAQTRAVRRFRKSGAVDCALRATDQSVQTIGAEWIHGDATIDKRHLTFHRHDSDEVVGPLRVLRLDESEMRLSPLRERHVIVRVVTDAGGLEWDLLAAVLDEVATRLGPS